MQYASVRLVFRGIWIPMVIMVGLLANISTALYNIFTFMYCMYYLVVSYNVLKYLHIPKHLKIKKRVSQIFLCSE